MAGLTNSFDALIFDCDGVLVNSEMIAQQVEMEWLARIGLEYELDEFIRRFSGTSEAHFYQSVASDVLERTGKPMTQEFIREMGAAVDDAINTRCEAIEGARDVAVAWSRKTAVASSSRREQLDKKLTRTNLASLFGERVYSADSVENGKPDPAIFLYAAGQLGIDPGQCIVIEDSVNGVIAAKRAGMYAIGFTGGGHCLPDQGQQLRNNGAEHVFEKMQDLRSLL